MSPRALALAACVTLAAAVRVHRLEEVPPGFYLDEAVCAVEGYSIATSGRDSWGNRFPVLFRGLGDWRHPLHIYSIALSEKVLGPTRFSVRLPEAVFGTLTVLLLALLVTELGGDARVGLVSALVLALTPWHIQQSRMAWEAVFLGFTAVLALLLHARARTRGGAGRFAAAGAGFGLALYSYPPAKLLVPALLAAIAAIELRERRAGRGKVEPRTALAFAAALALVALPLVVLHVEHYSEIQSRFEQISLLHGEHPARDILRSYFAHFDPRFLFVSGDPLLRHGWGSGELLPVTAAFVLAGIVRAATRRGPWDLLLLAWLAIFPLASAVTEGAPSALHACLGAPLFPILAAEGAILVLDRVKAARRSLVELVLAGALLANAGVAIRSYFVDYPRLAGRDWTSGVERLIPELVLRRNVWRRVHFMPGPRIDLWVIPAHVRFFTRFEPELDPGRPGGYFAWDQNVESWPRFLARLPRDEVLVTWGDWPWRGPSALDVLDDGGNVAFRVYAGLGAR